FFSMYQTQIPRSSKPCVAWPAHLKLGVPDEAPVTFHHGPEQELGSACISLGRGTSHCWNCGVPSPQQACERANHSSSVDRSSAPIVMEIALETVAPANIFRSTSELRNGKAARG
ncbi:hypothetical protein DV515_00009648, partial [Chloebia gouldiae]